MPKSAIANKHETEKDQLRATLHRMTNDFDDVLIRFLLEVLDAGGIEPVASDGRKPRLRYWRVATGYRPTNQVTDPEWQAVSMLFLAGLIAFQIEGDPPIMRWNRVDELNRVN